MHLHAINTILEFISINFALVMAEMVHTIRLYTSAAWFYLFTQLVLSCLLNELSVDFPRSVEFVL